MRVAAEPSAVMVGRSCPAVRRLRRGVRHRPSNRHRTGVFAVTSSDQKSGSASDPALIQALNYLDTHIPRSVQAGDFWAVVHPR
jgi:hypothetical protein